MKIIGQIQKELADFDEFKPLCHSDKTKSARYGATADKGYLYNQRAVLEKADKFFKSQFTNSRFDDEGQRLLFINQVQFPARVARKQVDVDVADLIFVPDTYNDARKIKFVRRQFQDWSKEVGLGQTINELLDDFVRYGTCVYRRIGNTIIKQDLHQLKNTYNAHSLKHAATTGGYVIIEHELSPSEMQEMKDWDLSNKKLDPYTKYKVYERFGLVEGADLNTVNNTKEYEEDQIYFAVTFILEDVKSKTRERNTVFMEEMSPEDFPLGEAHWEREPNRWLGVGEVENQFENQIAKNLTANLRRRALLWASKKVFQSEDPDQEGKSLVTEVPDGTILKVGRDGRIWQVDTSTQHLGDFQSFDNLIDQNSQQKSFTFEAATGETLPSGTPFRLGVVLSAAANTHFNLKKEIFSNMLNNMFFNDVVPIFKAMPKKKKLSYASDEEGVDELKQSMAETKAGQYLRNILLTAPLNDVLGTRFDKEAVKQNILKKIEQEPYYFINITDDYYDDLQFSMTLEVVGQYTNINKEVETLTNLLTLAMNNPQALDNPKIIKILELILAKTGQSYHSILGSVSAQSPEAAGLLNDATSQLNFGNILNNGQTNPTTA